MLRGQNCKIVISVTLSTEIYLTESHLMSESIFMSQSCIGISMEQECKHLYQKVCVSADEIVTVIGFELTVIKNGKNCTANPV